MFGFLIGKSKFMQLAELEAIRGLHRGENMVGAVIIDADEKPLGVSHSCTSRDSAAHAPMVAMIMACAIRGSRDLSGCHLYTTVEPCMMCATAISATRIQHLHYHGGDPVAGAVDHGARVFMNPRIGHVPIVHRGLPVKTALFLESLICGKERESPGDGREYRADDLPRMEKIVAETLSGAAQAVAEKRGLHLDQ